MGRIEEALRRAEGQRNRRRESDRPGLREITVEHLSGEARGFRRRFRQHSVMIGRGDHNDVAFDPFDEPTVSAHHAELRLEGDQVVLYDMGSLNGCFIGAERVRRALLEDGCEIGLGRNGPRVRLEIGSNAVTPGPAVPPIAADRRSVDPALPETAETEFAGRRGALSRFESSVLVAVFVAIVVDAAISLMRLG